MTKKLYDENSHLTEFTARVAKCEIQGEKYAVTLDCTAFFPEAGGQTCDRGTINGNTVSYVEIKDGEIYHYTDVPFKEGETVAGKIDWRHRFRNMQNHSGEHIISGLVHKLYGLNNVGFHLSEEMTMDFDGVLDRGQLITVENLANKAIYENAQIRAYYPTADELEKTDYRSKKEIDGDVRLVEIKGYDICACCAPHVNNTGEIGIIKILDFFKMRGGVRVFAKCGYDALSDYENRYIKSFKISNLLSVKQCEIAGAVESLISDSKELKLKISSLKKRIITEKAEAFIPQSDKTALFFEDFDIKELQLLSDAVYKKSGGVRGVFSKIDGGYNFAVCADAEQLEQFFYNFKQRLNVKGGGRNGMVQGTVYAEKQEIENLF